MYEKCANTFFEASSASSFLVCARLTACARVHTCTA